MNKVFVAIALLLCVSAVYAQYDTVPSFFAPHNAKLFDGYVVVFWEGDTIGFKFDDNMLNGLGYYEGPFGINENFPIILPTACIKDENSRIGIRCDGGESFSYSKADITDEMWARHAQQTAELEQNQSPFLFNHIGLDWNPYGHPPFGFFTVPHFDFHFYTISPATRRLARCTSFPPCFPDETSKYLFVPINQTQLPVRYEVDEWTGVPDMGIHAWQKTDIYNYLDQGIGWDASPYEGCTFVYGFINGSVCFLEIMVTQTVIKSKDLYLWDTPLPLVFERSGQWPYTYSIDWSEEEQLHTILMSDLTYCIKGETEESCLKRHDENDAQNQSSNATALFASFALILCALFFAM